MSDSFSLPDLLIRPLVRRALREDLGRAGDITSTALIPHDRTIAATLVGRAPGTLAGLSTACLAFRELDETVRIAVHRRDGERITAATPIATLEGPARAVLTGERVALNFLGHLSGVATATAEMVQAVEGYPARIVCTRKTTPGLRVLEKYAVRMGGGQNHRFGLDDGVLIKDNHLAVVGGVKTAVDLAREAVGHMVTVQVEVETLEQLGEAIAAGADAVLLDNMGPAILSEAVKLADGSVVTEASGGITLETVGAVAATGVDLISVGRITHSAPFLDVALDIPGVGKAVE